MLLNYEWTPERELARDTTCMHDHQIERIRQRSDLTPDAKVAHVEAVHRATLDRLAQLRQIEAERINTQLQELLANQPSTPDGREALAHLQTYNTPDNQAQTDAAYTLPTPTELAA